MRRKKKVEHGMENFTTRENKFPWKKKRKNSAPYRVCQMFKYLFNNVIYLNFKNVAIHS